MATPERRHWRLIVEEHPQTGAMHMAIDRALMESCGTQAAPPTLRIYRWAPAAVSLGKGQPTTAADLDRCRAAGVDVVRRPTGGWAIFHTDELTYSVAAHGDEPAVAGPLLEAYRVLSDGLIAGLRHMGLAAELAPPPEPGEKHGLVACFEVPYNNEITVGNKKLMGSAQARSGRKLMQHGSLPLTGDLGRAADYLVFSDEAARETLRHRLRDHATTVAQATGHSISFAAAAKAIITGFGEVLDIALLPGALSPEEEQLAQSYLPQFAIVPATT